MNKITVQWVAIAIAVLIAGSAYGSNTGAVANKNSSSVSNEEPLGNHATLHKTIEVNGLKIFYREAGPKNGPTLLLLHGYPTSSHMFRNLIEDLSHRFTCWLLIIPDMAEVSSRRWPILRIRSIICQRLWKAF